MISAALLIVAAAAGHTVDVRVIPRFDGVVFELTSDAAITDSISVNGYSVMIRPGGRIRIPDAFLPFWVYRWNCHEDSLGLTVETTPAIDSLEYSLSRDSLTLLLFFRAAEPLAFPDLSWKGPPDEPDYTYYHVISDTSLLAALESGRESPWLDEFDRIVIDPGHGGRDPGAVGPAGTYEKDRTLEVALLVRDILNVRRPDIEVIMTRTTDTYVSLGERTRIANAMKADLFVSIHCNAATNRAANGFETFFLALARNDESRAVEILENSVIEFDEVYDPYGFGPRESPLFYLLADMAQSLYLERSSDLAVEIQRSFERRFPGVVSRGVKQAGFYVLKGALMPSVLVELAFISNPVEERMLQTLDFRLAAAEAIVDAILAFSDRH